LIWRCEEKKNLTLPGIETGPSTPYLVAVPTYIQQIQTKIITPVRFYYKLLM
jgi:hypothetical protein